MKRLPIEVNSLKIVFRRAILIKLFLMQFSICSAQDVDHKFNAVHSPTYFFDQIGESTSGEFINSPRTTGGTNPYGLEIFTLDTRKITIFNEGNGTKTNSVLIGEISNNINPVERLAVNGAVQIGASSPTGTNAVTQLGTIQYVGGLFQGYVPNGSSGGKWVTFNQAPSPWKENSNVTSLVTGTDNVSVGADIAGSKFHVTGDAIQISGGSDPLSTSDPTGSKAGLALGERTGTAAYAWIQSSTSEALALNPAGSNVGVGINNPSSKFHVNGGAIQISGNETPSFKTGIAMGENSSGNYAWIQSNSSEPLALNPKCQSGNSPNTNYVAIGFTPGTYTIGTGYILAVKGKILCEELKVKYAAQNWPDYVFDAEYPLRSLKETETYIQEHKHLPDLPSAAQIKEEGLEIGAMNALLLKKIEELTLHVIRQEKEIKALREKVK